ncbi:hypothetical protein B0F90DRAFT_1720977 [Multifurca ochricompacta]|uniref:Uncharacterized protein n=1 Tax=Multifurca ochricompacta TaxID=376703 RepID=A0AAD4M633_9AGAM|nr:hypothetical protein B0F90DRAFT_1720977 [Multifurca ochricompacta]
MTTYINTSPCFTLSWNCFHSFVYHCGCFPNVLYAPHFCKDGSGVEHKTSSYPHS